MNCPSCGAVASETARFCERCGSMIGAPAEDGERRLLTIVFSDLVGSTSIAEGIDPEEFRDLVRAYQSACVDVVEELGGYVAQYLGDGLVIYFGYPVAHGDDATRAVRAALRFVEVVPPLGLHVRVGIHTGLVVVGEMGAGERRVRDAVVGDAPNVAARLQSVADVDSVAASEDTISLTGSQFETRDLGTPTLKGITRAIRVFEVLGEHRTPNVSGGSPLVGRVAELAALERGWAETVAGSLGVIVVHGDSGVGKSRLVREFRDLVSGADTFELACSEDRRLSPLWPVIEAVRPIVDAGDGELAEDRDVLDALLGRTHEPLEMSPRVQRQRTIDALVRIVRRRAADDALLVLVEDAHWADPSTIEFLHALASSGARLLILITTRDRAVADGLDAAVIALEPLGDNDIAALADATSGGDLSDELRGEVVARADGIPLFAEELTRSLIELRDAGRLADATIPRSLHQSLAARLDRLGSAREIAQIASVLGREFDRASLAVVSGRPAHTVDVAIGGLLTAGLVDRRDGGFEFKHALVREVAYESLLRSRRRELHASVAGLLSADPSRTVAPEIVASHYARASMSDEAAEYWTRAARLAAERHALSEGIEYAERALDEIRSQPESPERDRRELTLIYTLVYLLIQRTGPGEPKIEPMLRRGLEVAPDGSPERFDMLGGLAGFYVTTGRPMQALPMAEEAVEDAERTQRRGRLLWAYMHLGVTRFFLGRLHDAQAALEASFESYDPDRFRTSGEGGALDPGIGSGRHLAFTRCLRGDQEGALRHIRRMRSIAEAQHSSFNVSLTCDTEAMVHLFTGSWSDALVVADEGHRIAVANGFDQQRGAHACTSGYALALSGSPREGARRIEDGHAELLAHSYSNHTSMYLAWAAEAWLLAGEDDLAASLIDRAAAFIARSGERYCEADTYRIKGSIAYAVGRRDDAEAAFARAAEIVRAQGCVGFAPKLTVSRASG